MNLLKGGLYHATLINTVSEGYAREIQTPEYGWGLEGVVRERGADLSGILNGVDYAEWSPETDPFIPASYTSDDLGGKKICKRELQQAMGLPERDDVPLIGMVSRLVKQKGIDVLAEAIPRILGLDLQFVMLGAGEPWAHFYFGDIAAAHPDKFACYIGYSEPLAHKVEAGADFFVMPSAFEPCGLNQMYSLAYGTPPVVRATGGLEDSVENFDEDRLTGDGLKFRQHSATALFDTIGWAAYTFYNNPKGLQALRKNGMKKRFTWDESALKYEALYRLAIRRRRGEEGARTQRCEVTSTSRRFHMKMNRRMFIQRGSARKGLAAIIAVLLLATGYLWALEGNMRWRYPVKPSAETGAAIKNAPKSYAWQRWSPEAVAKARNEGKIVIVDFTAKWCITCNSIVKPALERETVAKVLEQESVVALLADYTAYPPEITDELARFNRAGVPLVLVYPKDKSQPPTVLPDPNPILGPGHYADLIAAALKKAAK